jgi:DeoR family glycerol-3-phosphate regulon repressor
MRPNKRRAAIAQRVRAAGKVTVEELALELDTSRETIRRDLTELAMEGKLRKFHGGATTPDSHMEAAFANRLKENYREKRVVAELAKGLFKEGDAIFMDNGTDLRP